MGQSAEKKKVAKQSIIKSYENIFDSLDKCFGLNWKKDENFKDSPERIARSLVDEKCIGLNSEGECKRMLENVTFPSDYNGFVIINPIRAHSICPHHFENIEYIVTTAYIPRGQVVGLSKISRVIKLFAAQPILQEDFTEKIADILEESIKPEALGLIVRGQHSCMVSRGVREHNAYCITSEVRGTCLSDPAVKAEFLRLSEFNCIIK